MKDGFIKVACITPKVRVADVTYNVKQIQEAMEASAKAGAMIVVFPELCITGYSCHDLFYQRTLLTQAKAGLLSLGKKDRKTYPVSFLSDCHGSIRANYITLQQRFAVERYWDLCQRPICQIMQSFTRQDSLHRVCRRS